MGQLISLSILIFLAISCGNSGAKAPKKASTAPSRNLSSLNATANSNLNLTTTNPNPTPTPTSTNNPNLIYNRIEAWTIGTITTGEEAESSESTLSNLDCTHGQVVSFKNLVAGMKLGGAGAINYNSSCAQDLFQLSCEFSRRSVNVRKNSNLKFILNSNSQTIALNCAGSQNSNDNNHTDDSGGTTDDSGDSGSTDDGGTTP
jgi:hypothetical protein